ncbi:hypothetical protein NQ315_005152 [Exocentrus adspersus]|uniref:RNase H type-1 domain-containing protein n=1 Tax=Exocentrus adspersus TaxID=1586481 RepID=A0AAV8VTY0_9CUCU|nr:hypothetical protein NQ315_005152 [Exocentrus adspersus]
MLAMAAFLRIRDAKSWRARGRKEGHAAYCPQGGEGGPNICHEGAGIYLENSGAQQSYSLSSYATVFQAVFAILMVAQREDVKKYAEEKIFICSNSEAALRAICSPRTRLMLVQECGDALESLARQKEVGLVWVPGHMGIPRNKRVDQLARLGSGERGQVRGRNQSLGCREEVSMGPSVDGRTED